MRPVARGLLDVFSATTVNLLPHTALLFHTILRSSSSVLHMCLYLRGNLEYKGQWDELQHPTLQLILGPHLKLIVSLFHSKLLSPLDTSLAGLSDRIQTFILKGSELLMIMFSSAFGFWACLLRVTMGQGCERRHSVGQLVSSHIPRGTRV